MENDEARITLRVRLTRKFKEERPYRKINSDLNIKLGFDKSNYRLSGVLILFNNLLQSLFKSQILTLGIVMLGIFIMFFFYLEILLCR